MKDEKRFDDIMEKFRSGPKNMNAQRIGELRSRLNDPNRPFALVVGTGVTASVGMPGWNALLGRLEINTLDLGTEEARNFRAYGASEQFKDAKEIFGIQDPLELAEFVRLGLPELPDPYGIDPQSLMKLMVRKALEADGRYITCRDSGTATYLSRTCELIRRYFREKGNRNIVTFNYDNLLEWYCEKLGIPANAIFDNAEPVPEKLNICHIHGFIGLKGTDQAGTESERIILTEDDYRDLERYPYCWENYLLLRALQEGDSLFLGFSGVDYNFRRMLGGLAGSASKNRNRRYIVADVDSMIWSVIEGIKKESGGSGRSEDMVSALQRRLEIQERYWAGKNFFPIWTTREDCPALLQKLMET